MAETSKETEPHQEIDMRPIGLDHSQLVAIVIILAGLGLSFYNALEPISAAYHLDTLVLVLNALPYLGYAILINGLRGAALVGVGLALFAVHLFLSV